MSFYRVEIHELDGDGRTKISTIGLFSNAELCRDALGDLIADIEDKDSGSMFNHTHTIIVYRHRENEIDCGRIWKIYSEENGKFRCRLRVNAKERGVLL